METPESIRISLNSGEWVTSIDLQDAYLHIPIHPRSRKYLRFAHRSQIFQFTSLPFGLAPAPQVFTMIVKEVKLMALSRGIRIHQYLDDWLIRAQSPEESSHNTKVVVGLTESLGWMINQVKSEFNRKNGPRRPPSHETLSVASQGELDFSSVAGQAPSLVRLHNSSSGLVAESTKCSQRCRSPPPRTQRSSVYRRLKRRLGRSLKSRFYQRTVVRSRKIIAHKRFRTKSSVLGPITFQASMPKSNSPSCHGQLNGSSLHQQTGRDSLSRDVRPSMENHELVSSIQNIATCQTHSRVPKCDRGLPVQINSNSVNRMDSTPSGVQQNLQKVVHSSGGSVCHSSEPQVATIVPDQNAWNIDALNISWSSLVAYAYPPNSSASKSNTKGPPVQLPPNPDSPGLAGHALVLGPGPPISGNSISVACVAKFTQAVKQPGVSQQSTIPQPPCLVSRSEQLQEQGFSSEVAERIAAPQRASTRSIYQAKWALFEKWCRESSVDVSKPSIKQVSDFFMHLFHDLNRRPSTIDGYRTAILDYLGPTGLHIAQSTDLNRLLTSFHRDRPKATRNIPKWNLSVVLNELTKKPFEPMKDSDIKHLTLKTAFFIALIHPIQWTMANPVGADRPAKRQKKTSCVATGWPVRSTVHSPDGASYFLPV